MDRRSKRHPNGQRTARRGLPVWCQAVLILIGVAGFAAASDAPSPSAIRTAQREAWSRFRDAHAELAGAVEGGVTTALTTKVSLRDVMEACATTDRSEALRDIAVSTALELNGREVTTRAWRCDTARDDLAASRICGCVVARMPDEMHTVVPLRIADRALAPYEGWLALRLAM
jgi:hypothetical protein